VSTSLQIAEYKTSDINIALRNAAAKNKLIDAFFFLSNGANIDDKDKKEGVEKASMHHAVIRKWYLMVALLSINGANLNLTDGQKKTPKDYVEKNDNRMQELFEDDFCQGFSLTN
jgi:hypothetical protein